MRLSLALLWTTTSFFATTAIAAEPAAKTERQTTKATYLITGLHCPPCTKTVESSLSHIEGIRSAKVDWRTKNAQIEFDETLIPAQTVAQRIASTPHMMGGNMQYGGWLALRVPEVKDEAAAKKAKETLAGMKGVKQVVVYAKQQSVGVQFDSAGRLTSRQLIDKLDEAGLTASTAFSAEPPRASHSTKRLKETLHLAQATPTDPHAGMEMDHSKMDMPNSSAAPMNHGAMGHAGMDHSGMGHMMGGCSMCMEMMGMGGMKGMSMQGMGSGMPAGRVNAVPASGRGYGGGARGGRGCGC